MITLGSPAGFFTPLSIVRSLHKRKLLIITVSLICLATTVAIVTRLRPLYKAESVVLVESQKIPETFVAATVQVMLEARLDMLKKQVLSQDRLWALIQEFGLYRDVQIYRTQHEVIELMRRDVIIALERGWSASRPGAFRVSYTTDNRRVAAEVVNRVAQFFIDENLRQREAEAQGTSEFLETQLAESKRQLQTQEVRLSEYKRSYSGELPQQEGALIASMGQSRVELLGTQDALARAQQSKLVLENSLAAAEATARERGEMRQRARNARAAESTPAGPREPNEIERAEARLRDLRLRYHDQHPEVQRALGEVARLQVHSGTSAPASSRDRGTPAETSQRLTRDNSDELAEIEENRIRELRSQLDLIAQEIQTLDARRKRILEEVADAQTRLKSVPIREQQLSAITRDYDTSRASYASLLNKKLAADVAKNMERDQKAEKFIMLDRARVPDKPVKPHTRMLIGLGGLGSLVFAAAFALLLEWRRNALLGEWELPPGTLVLGRVPVLRFSQRT